MLLHYLVKLLINFNMLQIRKKMQRKQILFYLNKPKFSSTFVLWHENKFLKIPKVVQQHD